MERFEHQPQHNPSSFEARFEASTFDIERKIYNIVEEESLDDIPLSDSETMLGVAMWSQLRQGRSAFHFSAEDRQLDQEAIQQSLRFAKLSYKVVTGEDVELFTEEGPSHKNEAFDFAEDLHSYAEGQFEEENPGAQRLIEACHVPLDVSDERTNFIITASKMAFSAAAFADKLAAFTNQREQEVDDLEALFSMPDTQQREH